MTRSTTLRAAALAVLAALPLAACAPQGPVQSAPAAPIAQTSENGRAKNVILFVGDGMGISTITAARILAGQQQGLAGEEYELSFDKFDNVALVKTYNTDAQVPDSAGTATAFNSGSKTRQGVLNIAPEVPRGDCAGSLDNRLPILADEVREKGKAVGIVSTARLTHATPAAVFGFSPDRNWEADSDIPEDQRGLGCSDLARQLVEYPFDLALGGGSRPFYGSAKGGARLEPDADLPAEWAARTGGSYVTTASAMRQAPRDKPVLGIFSASHMAYQLDRTADIAEPTLTEMTGEAIRRLSDDEDGYFLTVESGRIDHAHHAGRAGYALEETIEFARAIEYAVENTDPAETLILVTADHSHVFTIAGYPSRGNDILGMVDDRSLAHSDPEQEPVVLALDGKPYTTLGYANGPGAFEGERPVPETGPTARQQALIPLRSETHAGEDVALFGTGAGAHRVRGVIEQNLIYDIMRAAFGWDDTPEE